MRSIRVVVVDDEPLARQRIVDLLKGEPDTELVAECRDGHEAVAAIEAFDPDLVFLDVQMPEADGFDVVEAVGVERMPPVIFVTAYDQYARRAFDVRALDYLLKPFDRSRFTDALDRARRRTGDRSGAEVHQRLLALMDDLRAGTSRADRIVVKTGGRLCFLRTEEIDWIEAAGNYLRLHTAGGAHLIRETMTAMERRLDPQTFVRVHRSSIVNIDRVQALEPCTSGDYVAILGGGTRVSVSRGYRDQVLARLGRAQ